MSTDAHRLRGLQWLCAVGVALCATCVAAQPRYVPITGGVFRTALPESPGGTVRVKPYRLRSQPVSNREFAAFIDKHPEWRRSRVPTVFAGEAYLGDWSGETDFSPLLAHAPVTNVSWFAASAFCKSEGARLPTWHEWEFAAAADVTRRDARDDPVWRAEILGWYEQPALRSLPAMDTQHPNAWGVHDMHRLIWEWVEDYNGLFITVDGRNQGEQKLLETCGAAALSLGDRDNYAVLMRVALLSALDAKDSLRSMGFRCAR